FHPERRRREGSASQRRCGRARRPWHGGRRFPGVNPGVVVTGASTGIGAAIARHLAGRGFRVFGTVRRAEDEVALARDGVTVVRMDVTDTASIARAREQVERALAGAPLEGLVNNAGITAAGPLRLLPPDGLGRACGATPGRPTRACSIGSGGRWCGVRSGRRRLTRWSGPCGARSTPGGRHCA